MPEPAPLESIRIDAAIIGGGIAGLWLLNRLRLAGLCALLFEQARLGGGQSIKSQGIIHGGLKYALQAKNSSASDSLKNMPKRWMDCLQGRGELDLSTVPTLSPYQYLWSDSGVGARMATFFAAKTMQGRVERMAEHDYPPILTQRNSKGNVYRLYERVLDIPSLIKTLVQPQLGYCLKVDWGSTAHWQYKPRPQQHQIDGVRLQNGATDLLIKADFYINTAGAGNEKLLKQWAFRQVNAQKRPLHMVMLKQKQLPKLFAHCTGAHATPRLTITTHASADGDQIWYLGGSLAESGVQRSACAQIDVARQELATLFPHLDLSQSHWRSFLIDRAEPAQAGGKKPNTAMAIQQDNVIFAWPTKLALAPQLADSVCDLLPKAPFQTQNLDIQRLSAWPRPELAKAPWEEMF